MKEKEIIKRTAILLKEKKLTVATAESATGGLIANNLTNISGSSEYFDRGIISYSNLAKIELLGVSKKNLKKYGAVSKPVAKEMAEGVRIRSNVDIGLSTTGIAGPTGGSEGKPVGTIFIGVSTKEKTVVKRFLCDGDRLDNKKKFCNAALQMLFETIE